MATAYTDPKGRPIVAVTGMGVLPLAQARRAGQLSGLTAGRSGIRHITRFFAGARDFTAQDQ